MKNKYEIIIFWSSDDNVYIGEVPELPGCIAHGRTYKSALQHTIDAIDLWLQTANEFGDIIPEPKGERLIYA